jgi:hypothetical protein
MFHATIALRDCQTVIVLEECGRNLLPNLDDPTIGSIVDCRMISTSLTTYF